MITNKYQKLNFKDWNKLNQLYKSENMLLVEKQDHIEK